MLEEMRISGLGVIADALLDLHPGLTVVTGETGAGKTMVVEGLSLLFGGRADAGLVRKGSPRAVVEGRLALSGGPAVERALDAGGELADGALLVSRTVSAEGRSRAWCRDGRAAAPGGPRPAPAPRRGARGRRRHGRRTAATALARPSSCRRRSRR